MKDKRIVASFDKVSLPIDREDALLRRILQEADAERAALTNEREANIEYAPTKATQPHEKGNYRIPKKRKALLIAIAAILLLLSACAAYAIYWSSTQRAKEYVQSDEAVDNRRALAERGADEIISGTTYYGAIAGEGEMDGLTIHLRGACFWSYGDNELYLRFDAADAKTGDDTRLYDVDYVLTANGKDYPAYAKAEGTARKLPIISDGGPGPGEGCMTAAHQIWFRNLEDEIVDGTPLTLTCTLYAYDGTTRGERLGSCSLDFTYTIPHDLIAADRERLIAEGIAGMDAQAEQQEAVLGALSDEMTPLNITQDEYTFLDAQATQEGFVLGQRVVTRGSESPKVYMDGYLMQGEYISSIFTPDESRPRQDVSWEVVYYGTSETVTQYPWYALVDKLPETVLVAVLRDAGSAERQKGSLTGPEDKERGVMISYAWDAVELLLRVNPRTGEITLPRDEAERAAWRAETDRLMRIDDRNASYTLQLNGEQTVGDVTVSLYDVMVMSQQNLVVFEWWINGVYFWPETESSEVRLYIDGVLQDERETDREPYVFSQEAAEERVEMDGGWQKHNNIIGTFTMHMRGNELPETFTLRIAFDLYDRNEAWERVFVGSFDLTTTVRKTDLAPWDTGMAFLGDA